MQRDLWACSPFRLWLKRGWSILEHIIICGYNSINHVKLLYIATTLSSIHTKYILVFHFPSWAIIWMQISIYLTFPSLGVKNKLLARLWPSLSDYKSFSSCPPFVTRIYWYVSAIPCQIQFISFHHSHQSVTAFIPTVCWFAFVAIEGRLRKRNSHTSSSLLERSEIFPEMQNV